MMETSSGAQDTPQRPQISYNRGSYRDKFQGERKELLELAFLGEKEVKVEEPLSGYSGAQTWRVATDRRVFVIKLAHPTLIEREYANYRAHVIEHLGNTSRVQGEPIKSASREWALLKSTFARLRQSQTLLAYVEKKGSVDIAKILNNIFREYGEPWWGNAQNTRITCGVYYDRLLPVHLELVAFPPDGSDPGAKELKAGEVAQDQIADLEKDVIEHGHRPNIQLIDFHVEKVKDGVLTLYAARPTDVESPKIRIKLKSANAADFSPGDTITTYASNLKTRREILHEYARKVIPGFSADHDKFVVDTMEYPNPIPYLQKLLEATYDTKISTIHGDLNLSNILVEMDTNNEHYQQHWLIDFSETGEGPVLLDLQWLEVQVITWLLAPEIYSAGHSVNILNDIFESLHGFRELQSHLKATLQTPYTILQEIRRLVKDYYLSRNDWNEYYRGLVIGLIGALRFDQLEPQAQQIAFLSAATIIHWTEVLPSHLEGLPAPPTNIITRSEPPFIEMNSLPRQIACSDNFVLKGGAQATTIVQVKANRITVASTQADDTGRWQAAMNFDKAGDYQLTVKDNTSGAESKPIQITVVEAPMVLQNSIPTHILVNKVFALRGQARAKTELQILANDNVIVNTNTNGAGRWQAEISFAKTGTYEIRIQDDENGAESKPFSITVIAPPMIESASISAQLFPNRKFLLQGSAQANTSVQLLANQDLLATTTANHTGRWRAEIALGKPGSYTLTVRDDSNEVESDPVIATVVKSTPWTRTMLLFLSTVVTLLALVVAVSFLQPGLLPEPVNQAIATAVGAESSALPTSTSTPPPQPAVAGAGVSADSAVVPVPVPGDSVFVAAGVPAEPVACDPNLPSIKIGVAINESNRYAVFGQDQILGYNLAVNYFNQQQDGVNGRCIELVKVDLASRTDLEEDAEWLINQFNWLMQQGVVAIIGPGLSQQVDLMSDFWQSFKVPVIGPSTTKPKLVCDKDFFARISAPGLWYATAAIEEVYQSLTNVNIAKVVIAFADDDTFTNAESTIFRNYVTDESNQTTYNLVGDYPYQINNLESLAEIDDNLAKIADNIKVVSPDIVVISGLTRDGAVLIKELRAAGYTGPIVGGNGLNTPYIFNTCTGDCRDFENFFVPQAYSPLQRELPIQQAFLTAYTTADFGVLQQQKPRFDPNPGQFAAQMFTAVQVLIQSLEGIDEQTPIHDENLVQEGALVELRQRLNQQLLESNTLFETPLGPIRLTSEGEIVQTQFYVTQSVKTADDNGYHFETVSPLFVEDAETQADNACVTE